LNYSEQGARLAPWNYGTGGLTVRRRALHTQHVFQKHGGHGGRHELVVCCWCDCLAVHELPLPYRRLTYARL
jgi:hypothetical protein